MCRIIEMFTSTCMALKIFIISKLNLKIMYVITDKKIINSRF